MAYPEQDGGGAILAVGGVVAIGIVEPAGRCVALARAPVQAS